MVPTMIQMVLGDDEAKSRDYSSLRCLTYAGAPIAAATMRGAVDVFGPVLHQMYAQSEVAPVAMLMPWEHDVSGDERATRRLRSAGRPSPNVVITIVDGEGNPLPQGEIGEVAAWSPGCMSGIWGDKEATAARLLPDGSVLTRDMGFLDEDGFLFLADRKDDMLSSGGYNIWPIELEQVLIEHPGVAAACVVGVPSERWGESPLAGVVRTLDDAGAAVTAEELVALTAKRLGKVKRLSEVVFLDALPVSEAGKVQRAVLREPYWAGRAQQIGGACGLGPPAFLDFNLESVCARRHRRTREGSSGGEALLNTIARTGQVLELFTRSRPEWGVTEIAAVLGVPKSNAHEILSSLASIDLLRRTGRSRYRLGWRIMTMASEVVEARALRQHAPEYMRVLARATHETCHLAVWDGRRLVFVARVLGDDGLVQQHAEAGCMLPAHCTASGKALLADLPWDEVVDRIERAGGMVARTDRSLTSLDTLRDELDLIRERGYASNLQEADKGVSGIAVPVRLPDGRAIAALGLSVASERYDGLVRLHMRLLSKVARRLERTIAVEVASVDRVLADNVDYAAQASRASTGRDLAGDTSGGSARPRLCASPVTA